MEQGLRTITEMKKRECVLSGSVDILLVESKC